MMQDIAPNVFHKSFQQDWDRLSLPQESLGENYFLILTVLVVGILLLHLNE